MKTNLRGKIREFIHSEEGKVGIKTPLALGIATSSVLLAQASLEHQRPKQVGAKVTMNVCGQKNAGDLGQMAAVHVINNHGNIGCGVDRHKLVAFSVCGSFCCHALPYRAHYII